MLLNTMDFKIITQGDVFMSEMQNKLYDTANEMPLIDIRDGMFSREDSFGGYDVRSVHEFLTRINKLVASNKNEAALERRISCCGKALPLPCR